METPDIKKAIASVQHLPTLPAVLSQIIETVSDPASSALDLARYIASDQSLSARILQLVNSAYYGFRRKISSVTDAVVILGFSEVRNLALTATAFTTLKDTSSGYDRTRLWRHSLAAAMAADRSAKRLHMPPERPSFSAALLHDIGKVALDVLYPDRFIEAVKLANASGCRMQHAETLVFHIDHAEVGALLADHWGLPEPIVDAVRFHHAPANATVAPELAAIVSIANFLTYRAGMGEPGNGLPPGAPDEAMTRVGMTAEMGEEVAIELSGSAQRIDNLLGSLTSED